MSEILLVEDDPKICRELSTLLERYGYTCRAVEQFDRVEEEILRLAPQLVLLDINLPYYDGYHICRQVRKRSNVPIIVVTSRDSEMDELMSMNLGADDFVTKPYNTQILLARIAAVLKRSTGQAGAALEYQGVILYPERSIVEYQGKQQELTKNELKILQLLLRNPGVILSREKLMNELWQSDEFVDDNTLTVNINRLRRKLEQIGVQDFLITKRGQGYRV